MIPTPTSLCLEHVEDWERIASRETGVDLLRPLDAPGVDRSLLVYNSFGFTRNALLNTLETGWTVLPPSTNLVAKSKEFGCLHDRVQTKAWFCGSLLLALSGRKQSLGFAFCRS